MTWTRSLTRRREAASPGSPPGAATCRVPGRPYQMNLAVFPPPPPAVQFSRCRGLTIQSVSTRFWGSAPARAGLDPEGSRRQRSSAERTNDRKRRSGPNASINRRSSRARARGKTRKSQLSCSSQIIHLSSCRPTGTTGSSSWWRSSPPSCSWRSTSTSSYTSSTRRTVTKHGSPSSWW